MVILILSFIIPLAVTVGIIWLIEYVKYRRWCRIHDAQHEAEMRKLERDDARRTVEREREHKEFQRMLVMKGIIPFDEKLFE
jgi:hypothetical protein